LDGGRRAAEAMREFEFQAKTLDWTGEGAKVTARIITQDGDEVLIHFGARQKQMIDEKFPPEKDAG
jgi:hypothetical protein